jgi:S1-C subfamily serine protease
MVFVSALTTAMPQLTRADDVDDARVRNSVVKISSTIRRPDVFRPWTHDSQREATGSGVVITGNRILTNAHMVNYASQIFIQPDKSSEKLPAKLKAIAPGIDLAVLSLEDESFFHDHPPLPINPKLPRLQQTAFTYGYPEGGVELSITRGIVSRIEYAEYYLMTEGLRIQVDAAINPGNSGGPVVVDGQMIGIVFSKLSRSDNIGYIIPMEEIDRFLKDIEDGHYDGKPVLPVEVQHLENEALRSKLKLERKTTGVLVRKAHRHDMASYPLQVGDIITEIGERTIDNAGMVRAEEDHLIKFQYLVQRSARDGRLSVSIMRNGQEQKLDVPISSDNERRLLPAVVEKPPSYFVYGPLVFTEATDDYAQYLMDDGNAARSVYSANPIFTRYGDRPAFAGERIVVVAYPMFTHKISKGFEDPYAEALAEVNGVFVRNLKHLVETLRDATGEFIEFTFHNRERSLIVFQRKEVLEATEEVLNDNGIRRQYSADIGPIWNDGKPKNR